MAKKGKQFDEEEIDSLDIVFHYARPVNEKDVIENLVLLSNINAISRETVMDIAPFITNSKTELERIRIQENE